MSRTDGARLLAAAPFPSRATAHLAHNRRQTIGICAVVISEGTAEETQEVIPEASDPADPQARGRRSRTAPSDERTDACDAIPSLP